MSRIGIKPVALASGVEVTVEDRHVSVKGPLGQLGWDLADGIDVDVKDGAVHVGRRGNSSEGECASGQSLARADPRGAL